MEAMMGAAENLTVHTRWGDAENHHDVSHHSDFIHDDIEVHMPGAESVQGIDAYRAMMESVFQAVPDYHFELDDQFATDDRVVCRARNFGTHRAESFGFPATAKHFEFASMSLWHFEDGKARRGWIYLDLPSLTAQLGS
jgi:steroid delta-isomerase-like uncharacterized protein